MPIINALIDYDSINLPEVPEAQIAQTQEMFELHQRVYYNNQAILLTSAKARYIILMLGAVDDMDKVYTYFTYVFTHYLLWKNAPGVSMDFCTDFRHCIWGGDKLNISIYTLHCICENGLWEHKLHPEFDED